MGYKSSQIFDINTRNLSTLRKITLSHFKCPFTKYNSGTRWESYCNNFCLWGGVGIGVGEEALKSPRWIYLELIVFWHWLGVLLHSVCTVQGIVNTPVYFTIKIQNKFSWNFIWRSPGRIYAKTCFIVIVLTSPFTLLSLKAMCGLIDNIFYSAW